MSISGSSIAKAEMFLIAVAALCLLGAGAALVVQYTGMMSIPPPTETMAATEQDEPARVPLPAGPRKFQ